VVFINMCCVFDIHCNMSKPCVKASVRENFVKCVAKDGLILYIILFYFITHVFLCLVNCRLCLLYCDDNVSVRINSYLRLIIIILVQNG
jgi:hypothetical protein